MLESDQCFEELNQQILAPINPHTGLDARLTASKPPSPSGGVKGCGQTARLTSRAYAPIPTASGKRRTTRAAPPTARVRRAAVLAGVLAARMLGGTRTVHVRRVTLLLAGETAPRHARVRAAAAAAAANSGPIGTIGLR